MSQLLPSPFTLLMLLVNGSLALLWLLMHRRRLPQRLDSVFRYGKAYEKRGGSSRSRQDRAETPSEGHSNKLLQMLTTTTLPKSCFRWFYVAALVMDVACFLAPHHLAPLVRLLFARGAGVYLSLHSSYVTVWLLQLLHVSRRAYECFFVSVYAPSSLMLLLHAATGLAFYAGSAVVICNRAFVGDGAHPASVTCTCLAVSLTLYASGSWIQWISHQTLAGLRRRRRPDGKLLLVTMDHMIPYGHWFEYTSNPHYFGEVLIYASFVVVTGFDATFLHVFLYVLFSHLLMAEQSHRWYQQTFGHLYPHRCILFPFLL